MGMASLKLPLAVLPLLIVGGCSHLSTDTHMYEVQYVNGCLVTIKAKSTQEAKTILDDMTITEDCEVESKKDERE